MSFTFNAELAEIFSTDSESEEEGIWVDLTDEISFKVRAIGAKRVIDRREELMRPFQGIIKAGGKVPEAKNEEIGKRVLAEAVLADWKGIKNAETGDDVPYSGEAAYALLDALPRMANFVIQTSTDQEAYRQSNREEDAGN